MKKKLIMMLALLTFMLITACGQEKEIESKTSSPDPTEPIKVDLQVPDKGEKNETIPLKASVTHDGEPVADAADVQYEIWLDSAKEKSKMIKSRNEKDGTYTADNVFSADGNYTVQVHVTARDQHNMPTKKIVIGKALSKEKSNHGHSDHEHAEDFSMHFMKPDTISNKQETQLTVHLEKHAKPLVKAQVRYEISQADVEKHAWVDANETKLGEYTAHYTFPKTGDYTVKVHVENDQGLHEHEEHKVTSK